MHGHIFKTERLSEMIRVVWMKKSNTMKWQVKLGGLSPLVPIPMLG